MNIWMFEKKLTEQSRTFGMKNYRVWKWISVHGLLAYLFFAFLFSLLGMFTSWMAFVALSVGAYILINVVQLLIRRKRPPFEELTDYRMWWRTYSMPSGHATASAVATVFLLFTTKFPDPLTFALAAITFGVLALLISFSRLVVGVHYFFDIVVGLVLGACIALGYCLFVL